MNRADQTSCFVDACALVEVQRQKNPDAKYKELDGEKGERGARRCCGGSGKCKIKASCQSESWNVARKRVDYNLNFTMYNGTTLS